MAHVYRFESHAPVSALMYLIRKKGNMINQPSQCDIFYSPVIIGISREAEIDGRRSGGRADHRGASSITVGGGSDSS